MWLKYAYPLRRALGQFENVALFPQGEVAVITASSQSLLFHPGDLTQLVGGSECNSDALVFRARLALTLEGRILPPVEDVTVTLTSGIIHKQIYFNDSMKVAARALIVQMIENNLTLVRNSCLTV